MNLIFKAMLALFMFIKMLSEVDMRNSFWSLLFICFSLTVLNAEEGMFPLSQLGKLDLKKAGFEVNAIDIFDENGISISDAIVKVGGCSGSFVSSDGLILTNHHCAFRAIQAVSTKETDHLKNGYLAKNRSLELQAKGYTVRITESFKDVSKEVLSILNEEMTYDDRVKAIRKKRNEIVKGTEKENPGKRAEVAEMVIGKSYVLFLYSNIKDVRLVYFPPRSLGEFGGEYDNWEWPRHEADFAFLRAYVAPDGSPADYSEDNIPYNPKKFLKVNPNGVNEEDLVFILGYPGRTYRHRTSSYMDFQEKQRMPFVQKWYEQQINMIDNISANDRSMVLKHASKRKGLANTEKNYRGALPGMKRINLVANKIKEEEEIQRYIESDTKLKEEYGDVLQGIKKLYADKSATAQRDFILSYLTRSVDMLRMARTLIKNSEEQEKDDLARESYYTERNLERTKNWTLRGLNNYNKETDKTSLKALLKKANNLPDNQRIEAIDNLFGLNKEESDVEKKIEKAYTATILNDKTIVKNAFDKSIDELKEMNDPILNWYFGLKIAYEFQKEKNEKHSGAINKLYGKWIEVKRQYLKTRFVPDANSTFRLTYGRVRGYSPKDGIYKKPFTTLTGVIQKTGPKYPFNTPQKVIDLYNAKDFGKFAHQKLNDLPVDILMDLDTTGGNSGSAIMNARGELIGLLFDGTFESCASDYAWEEGMTRSIGVDIRYILWVTQKFSGADHLITELGVK